MPLPYKLAMDHIPSLPNHSSDHQTTGSKIIDLHYANLLLVERWTWERYVRLAAYLKLTHCELASLVLMSHKSVDQFREKNQIQAHNPRPIAMLLTLLEHHVAGHLLHDTIANPFPNLNLASGCTTHVS